MATWKKLRKAIEKTGRGETVLTALKTRKGRSMAAAALANTLGTQGGTGSSGVRHKGKGKPAKVGKGAKRPGSSQPKLLLKPSGPKNGTKSRKGSK